MPAIPIRQGPLILVVFAFQILICIQKVLKLQQAISGRILASTLELSQVVDNHMNFQYIILHASLLGFPILKVYLQQVQRKHQTAYLCIPSTAFARRKPKNHKQLKKQSLVQALKPEPSYASS